MSTFVPLQRKRASRTATALSSSSSLHSFSMTKPLPVRQPGREESRSGRQAERERATFAGHSIARLTIDRPIRTSDGVYTPEGGSLASQTGASNHEAQLFQQYPRLARKKKETAEAKGVEGRAEHHTGLPVPLKAGIEALSGLSLGDVRVHYRSPQPAKMRALAYTQGTQIHVGPGQEEHLAHEAWHVVQQKQGRVKPSLQAKGVAINDDHILEREADVMGARASVSHNFLVDQVDQQKRDSASAQIMPLLPTHQSDSLSPYVPIQYKLEEAQQFIRERKSKFGDAIYPDTVNYKTVKAFVDDTNQDVGLRRGLLAAWNEGQTQGLQVAVPPDLAGRRESDRTKRKLVEKLGTKAREVEAEEKDRKESRKKRRSRAAGGSRGVDILQAEDKDASKTTYDKDTGTMDISTKGLNETSKNQVIAYGFYTNLYITGRSGFVRKIKKKATSFTSDVRSHWGSAAGEAVGHVPDSFLTGNHYPCYAKDLPVNKGGPNPGWMAMSKKANTRVNFAAKLRGGGFVTKVLVNGHTPGTDPTS